MAVGGIGGGRGMRFDWATPGAGGPPPVMTRREPNQAQSTQTAQPEDSGPEALAGVAVFAVLLALVAAVAALVSSLFDSKPSAQSLR